MLARPRLHRHRVGLAAIESSSIHNSLHLLVFLHGRLQNRHRHARLAVAPRTCRHVFAGAAEHESIEQFIRDKVRSLIVVFRAPGGH